MDNKVFWGFHNDKEEFRMLEEGYIALGWKEIGDLSSIDNTRESYYDRYNSVYPGNKKMSVSNSAGQLFRFVNEANIGDYVIFPSKFDRKVNIGIIKSDYYYDSSEREYPQKRKVEWILTEVDRNKYSQAAKYEFGSFLSFFKIKKYTDEHLSIITGKKVMESTEQEDESISIEAIEDSTKDYIIKEISKNYKGYDFENVVSSLLNAMGYRTKNSPKGGDHGKDIIVYRDELPPRIVVQVKSNDGDITEETVQSLKGALNDGDYGLFVTLSDFKKNAKEYLERQSRIKSINGSEFVDLLLKYYDDMPEDFRDTIRLKKVYMPVLTDDKED
ncbi:MAG: restriction endonuclease [Lachnospiraceae bacterium]|nr:restriction endonuclease [Lachnospiraceae bacterium]